MSSERVGRVHFFDRCSGAPELQFVAKLFSDQGHRVREEMPVSVHLIRFFSRLEPVCGGVDVVSPRL